MHGLDRFRCRFPRRIRQRSLHDLFLIGITADLDTGISNIALPRDDQGSPAASVVFPSGLVRMLPVIGKRPAGKTAFISCGPRLASPPIVSYVVRAKDSLRATKWAGPVAWRASRSRWSNVKPSIYGAGGRRYRHRSYLNTESSSPKDLSRIARLHAPRHLNRSWM